MEREKLAWEYTCETCGMKYIVRSSEVCYARTDSYKHFCLKCQRAYHEKKKQAAKARADEGWEKKKAEEQRRYEALLSEWKSTELSDIRLSGKILYIIGNGFDLMHGVRSGYYDFRDTLGKNSGLRFVLENFWKAEDIWSDFENELAHFNMDMMGSRGLVGSWLDDFDAFDEGASVSSFYLSAETAAQPIMEVSTELPRRFRNWVDKLTPGTDDRPLKDLIHKGGKVIDFNYTEFIETLYDIPEEDVCYIHGCRKSRKEHLILGHSPDASEDSYRLSEKPKKKLKTYRDYMVDLAQDEVFRLVSECDDTLTKDCRTIISAHEDFFDSLAEVRNIVVIGHSMSPVDWPYFEKIKAVLHHADKVKWYIGTHGLSDLMNMRAMADRLGILQKNLTVFRTDMIRVSRFPEASRSLPEHKHKKKILGLSSDNRWRAELDDGMLRIIDIQNGTASHETLAPRYTHYAMFKDDVMFLIVQRDVLLFSYTDGKWKLVDELKPIPNQGLLNQRLRKVYLRQDMITFVYNGRVRRYSLKDGSLLENKAMRQAPERVRPDGYKDVTEEFMK